MNNYLTIVLLFLATAYSPSVVGQQIDTIAIKKSMDFLSFISAVGRENVAYAAARFDLDIAQAEIQTAGIFPDPELGFGWFDNGERRMKMGYGFTSEMTWTLELGGKRKARVNLARDQHELTSYLLDDYFRNLRADATIAYLRAIQNRQLLVVQLNSYQQLSQLAASDSIRYQLGVISQVDARQSKLEAGASLNEVYAAEAQYNMAISALSLLIGDSDRDLPVEPQGDLLNFDRTFNLQELITSALNNRADLKAALQSKNVSASVLRLARANRALDLGLTLGGTYSSYARNAIAPTPAFTTVNAGLSIPLKFSNGRSGELPAARYASLQGEQLYRQTELEVRTSVVQAFYTYQSAGKQVRQFDRGLLSEALAILDGKVYSYKRGETSLLELLNAQRTYNEVQQGYYQALYGYAEALVELERASGIWDINF